jgi:hypothetical protein
VLLGKWFPDDIPLKCWKPFTQQQHQVTSQKTGSLDIVILMLQENLSRPVYVPKTATEQLKEIFERQQKIVSSLDEKQAE